MSMTSKVNATLRSEIVSFLAKNPNSTNLYIYFGINSLPSVRTFREATQKLTADGTLVRTGKKFSVAPATENAVAATV